MSHSLIRKRIRFAARIAPFAALAFLLAFATLPVRAQQEPPDQQGAPGEIPPQEQQGPPEQPESQAPQYQNVPENYTVPETLTLPAGTLLLVRTTDWISTDRNKTGDLIVTYLGQPVIVGGLVVARRGQAISGRIADARKAGRVKGVSQLRLELNQMTLVDGQLLPLATQLLQATASTSNGRDAAAIVGTTAFGAAVGGAATGGPGAAIGAGAGFVASLAGVLLTRGYPTVITPETLLTFRLQNPVTFSTVRGQAAFRPPTESDYPRIAQQQRRRRPSPPPPPSGYYPNYYSASGYYGPRYGYWAPW
jgi:hypothetical protein